MTREEFKKVLDRQRYSYKIKGDKIVITDDGIVWLNSLETLPPGVVFKNGEGVWMKSLEILPPGVEFKNGGDVDLGSLETLPPDVKFNNGGDVQMNSLETISPDVEFNNSGSVRLVSLVGGWFKDWPGNIEGIDSKRLLNLMISKGIFER